VKALGLRSVTSISLEIRGADETFPSIVSFAARLRFLRAIRKEKKLSFRAGGHKRRSLNASQRREILMRTAGRCHICGGEIQGRWDADHVFSHSLGGQHTLANYLAAHPICNNYRWFYGTQEFQWILKLGVWLRTQIEKEERIGVEAGVRFLRHERKRSSRRRVNEKRE
jgi:hypothetical protein